MLLQDIVKEHCVDADILPGKGDNDEVFDILIEHGLFDGLKNSIGGDEHLGIGVPNDKTQFPGG